MFKALVIDKQDGNYTAGLSSVEASDLPEGDVAVDIDYSTLNYKDGLAITGKRPVVRQFPMVPGIDFAGTVSESRDARFNVGDKVFLNGWGVGEVHWGGLAQKARVKGDWLLATPEGLTSRDIVSIGTAGYTAMLCVQALENHGLTPDKGDILVTGAAGGVGSFAVFLLAQKNFRVVASTGRPEEASYLKALGAADIIDRAELGEPGDPLQKERWAGAVDSVGSHTLANVCASTRYGGAVAACGLAQGMDLPASVAPFILRGVSLLGIDSVYCPLEKRQAAWQALSESWSAGNPQVLESITADIGLGDAIAQAQALLDGSVRGRIIVDVNR